MDLGDNIEMKLAVYWHVLQTGKEGKKGNKRIRIYVKVAALINIDARVTNENVIIWRKTKNLFSNYMRRKVIQKEILVRQLKMQGTCRWRTGDFKEIFKNY